jgi:hypothetical protein
MEGQGLPLRRHYLGILDRLLSSSPTQKVMSRIFIRFWVYALPLPLFVVMYEVDP